MSAAAEYEEFLSSKFVIAHGDGIDAGALPPQLFPFQRDAVTWALNRGRAALFLDTGLGKSFCQLAWAARVAEYSGGRVLILAPLAVAAQTIREGVKIGIHVEYVRDQSEVDRAEARIVITNYDRLGKFDAGTFSGVVLDESSILKSFMGATKRALLELFANTRFRLACTATPAPNDHLELGNHAEFLGVLTSHEMIARWFITDQSEFGTYRLKGHAIEPFWNWVTSWARCAGLPSDMGPYDDAGYVLPALEIHKHIVEVDITKDRQNGSLFRIPEMSATSVHKEKRISVGARADRIASLVNEEPNEPWVIWCDTDYESDALQERLPHAVDVRGSMSPEAKERALIDFSCSRNGKIITKPKLAGFGLNWQHCARVAFVGATFSFESYYQAIRRCWRFGQERPVRVHVALASTEDCVWDVMQRKSVAHESMKREMFAAARRAQSKEDSRKAPYLPIKRASIPTWIRSGS